MRHSAIAASGHEAVLYRPGSELPSVDVMLFEPGMGQRVIALAKMLAPRRLRWRSSS